MVFLPKEVLVFSEYFRPAQGVVETTSYVAADGTLRDITKVVDHAAAELRVPIRDRFPFVTGPVIDKSTRDPHILEMSCTEASETVSGRYPIFRKVFVKRFIVEDFAFPRAEEKVTLIFVIESLL